MTCYSETKDSVIIHNKIIFIYIDKCIYIRVFFFWFILCLKINCNLNIRMQIY